MGSSHRTFLALIAFAGLGVYPALAAETVTVDNFVRAQSDVMFRYYASQGGFGKVMHVRGMTPVEKRFDFMTTQAVSLTSKLAASGPS